LMGTSDSSGNDPPPAGEGPVQSGRRESNPPGYFWILIPMSDRRFGNAW
jgi:hypothetical protein